MVCENELKCEYSQTAKQNFWCVWVVLVLACVAPKNSALRFGVSFAVVARSGQSAKQRRLSETLKNLRSVLSASNLAKL